MPTDCAIQKLASIASYSFAAPLESGEVLLGEVEPEQWNLVRKLYCIKNGFCAFESALQVFPTHPTTELISLPEWNAPGLWRGGYGDLSDGCLFFAQDVFAFQFCVYEGAIHSFDLETGEKKFLATDLESWANMMLKDYRKLTGYPIAQQWQAQHGPLKHRERLMGITPFVCGGTFTCENLAATDVVELLQQRGDFAMQIRNLPDGSRIGFEVED